MFTKKWVINYEFVERPPSFTGNNLAAAGVYKFKEKLISSGMWQVVSSSNGTSFAASDLWSSYEDVTFGSDGSNHSWILLEQVGSSDSCQIILDANSSRNLNILISLSSSYSGGSVSTKPTAGDGTSSLTIQRFSLEFFNSGSKIISWTSMDKTAYRFAVIVYGAVVCYFSWEKLINQNAEIDYPYVSFCFGNDTNLNAFNASVLNTSNFSLNGTRTIISFSEGLPVAKTYPSGQGFVTRTSFQRYNDSSNSTRGEINYTYETSRPQFKRIYCHSQIQASWGILGEVVDCFFWRNMLTNGRVFRVSDDLMIGVGPLVLPWNSSLPRRFS